MKWRINSRAYQQRGIASIIVVFIITVLISLVSLGFARLMDRALQNISDSQLGAAADYAAQSGINDAIALVRLDPTTTADECNDLLVGTAGPNNLVGKNELTTDKLTKYTCVLINPQPDDLAFQNLPPYNSQVVKLASASGAPLSQLMFSWQANNQAKRTLASGELLQTERNWGNSNYPPVLRITLYPISANAVPATGATRTFYLYPNSSDGSISYSASSGEIIGGRCNTASTSPWANTGYQCNVVINNLTSAEYYEARLTPLYVAADVGIQAIDASGVANFRDAQSVIDVTGKSNTAVRRIQARVDTGGANVVNTGSNAIPEDAIRSANTICKRLVVPFDPLLSSIVYADPTSVANSPICGFFSSTLPALTVNLTANPTTVTVGGSSTLTWSVSGIATSCTATNDRGLSTWNGAKSTGGGSQSTGPLNSLGVYNFSLTCTNPTGQSGTDNATVTVNPAAPVVTLNANPTSVTVGSSSTLTWTVTNNPTSCTASNDASLSTWTGSKSVTGGSQSTGALNTVRTYNFTLTCSNAGGTGQDSAQVTVNPLPPPPPPPPPGPTPPPPPGPTPPPPPGPTPPPPPGPTPPPPGPTPPPPPPSGSCPNPQGGGDGNQDPCVQSFSASRTGQTNLQFNFRADHCNSNFTISYPGGSLNFGSYAGGFNDVRSVSNATSSAGTASASCTGEGWSSASAGFDAWSPPPPPPGPPPPPPPLPPPPPPPAPYIVYYDCHPSGGIYWVYAHWSDGRHENQGWGLPGFCAI